MKEYRGFFKLLFLVALITFFPLSLQAETKTLSKEHTQKIMRMADFVAGELVAKDIKKVVVKPFCDAKGRQTEDSASMTETFVSGMKSAGKNIEVLNGGSADAVVSGVIMPFRGGEKIRLKISAVQPGTNKIITSYTGYFKKPKLQ